MCGSFIISIELCLFCIHGYHLATINCGIPLGPVLGPLLFLLYINDLNQAIKFCKAHHLADDTTSFIRYS